LEDLDGCGTELCGACANAQKREFFSCSHCDINWCTVCNPELKQPVCRFCGDWWCDKCDPGTRPIVDTLLDGFQVRPYARNHKLASKSDVCCPTCEVTEFIFA
jgi:hypothetical protein